MNAYIGPLILMVLGGTLVGVALQISEYKDANWKQKIETPQWQVRLHSTKGGETQAAINEWSAAQKHAATRRDRLFDLGSGIFVLGAALAAVFGLNCVRRFHDLCDMKSPATKFRFVGLAGLAWFSFVPALLIWWYYIDTHRENPPLFDDSIVEGFYLILNLVGLLIVVWKAEGVVDGAPLPARLWTKPKSSEAGGGFTIVSALWGIATLWDVWWAPQAVLSDVLILYVLLSARAAVIARYEARQHSFVAPGQSVI